MDNPSVVVIVPVYNGKEYLGRCMHNLLNQTYDNYSIILVDDGSTDGSREICDKYEETNSFVKVIHQENRGLSAARNIGVEQSDSDYILFVDSDDYVSTNIVEDLVTVLVENNANMATIRVLAVGDELRQFKSSGEDIKKNTIIMDTEKALENMCYKHFFGTAACGKLFERSIVQRYPFPEDVIFEDLATTYKMIGDCRIVAHLDIVEYYYTQHNNVGITRSRFSEKHLCAIQAAKEVVKYISQNYPNIVASANYRMAYVYYVITKSLQGGGEKERDQYRVIRKQLGKLLFRKGVLNDLHVGLMSKMQLMSVMFGYHIMLLSWRVYYKFVSIR